MGTTKVIAKRTKKYKGKVYDLHVPGFHTYNIEDKIVHNSGAGSLVIYSLGVSKIDPIKYNLLFERFLSESRTADMVYDWFNELEE